MAEEETIGDVLTRVSALHKDEMITEVESYGLEVKSSWTKDEIMENFEQFLLEESPDGDAPEEPVVEEKAAEEPVLPPLDLPEPPPPPPTLGEPSIVPQTYAEETPASPNVRIMRSPGWGKTGGAHAP